MDAVTERVLSLLFVQSPQPMWIYDRETLQFVAVNDAAVHRYGFTRDEFLGMTLADIRPAEDIAALRASVRTGPDLDAKNLWRHRRKDGSIVVVEVVANDLTLDGRPLRVALINDVTEREQARASLRQAEEQLRQAQKMEAIGRLAGGIAHDFNNILTVVQSYACLVEEAHDDGDPRREDVIEIRRATERATALTRQLLTMSRHSVVSPRPVRLDEIVSGFIPMLRRVLGEPVTILSHVRPVPPVLADAGQLEQVLMNLAVNARDAMPGGGRLTIETSAGRGEVELAVTDTGTGMDRETVARVFEPFFTTKEVGQGTGLGLSIVHGIVSQAGGAISVYSELGVGTTFRVRLPVTDAAATAAAAANPQRAAVLPAATVLVVDDDEAVREVAGRVLRDAGCAVLTAATAEAARRLCVSHEGDIAAAVIDVVLPDGRGEPLSRELRALRPGLGVVLTSGYPAGALGEAGGTPPDLLAKPYMPDELRGAVARVTAAAPANDASGERRAATRGGGPRVLIADDDPRFRLVIARVLRGAGCEIAEVGDGEEAIAALASSHYDVLISDLYMPGLGGIEVLSEIRRLDLDVPVILISGTPDVATASKAVELGAFRYLTKPFDLDALKKLVPHAARAHALARLQRRPDRAGLELRFEQAVDRLWVAFQPIVEARTGAIYGVEALMRSDEPTLSMPRAILDAAGQLGQLARLGRRVRALAAAGIAATDRLNLFLNVHPQDLADAELLADDAPLTMLAPRVVLEITERAALETSVATTERIRRLRQRGFRLAVDDLGAGYSGLTSFTELTPEVVKLDMALVRDLHRSQVKQRTVGALCSLCHEVDALVVGQGVETVEERDCLVDLGCDLLQGFLFGPPSRDLPVR